MQAQLEGEGRRDGEGGRRCGSPSHRAPTSGRMGQDRSAAPRRLSLSPASPAWAGQLPGVLRGYATSYTREARAKRTAPAGGVQSKLLRLVACRANWRAERTPPACTYRCTRFRTDQDVHPTGVKFTTYKIMTEKYCASICEAARATLTQTRARQEPITSDGSSDGPQARNHVEQWICKPDLDDLCSSTTAKAWVYCSVAKTSNTRRTDTPAEPG